MALSVTPETTCFHLLGKAGAGKSSTGNTILKRKIFKTSSSTTSFTKTINVERGGLGDWHVAVVDGPGLVEADGGISRDSLVQLRQFIVDHPSYGHVFLVVCRYGSLFNEDDSKMIRQVKAEFGRNVFRERGIVLVTCGDCFERDHEDEGETFESWCRSQGGSAGKLFAECGRRVLLVDNSQRVTSSHDLLPKLEELMPTIQYGGKPFVAARPLDLLFGQLQTGEGRCSIS